MKRLATAGALAAIGLLLAVASVACQSESQKASIDSATPEVRSFPNFVYTSTETFTAYVLATENRDLFARLPCFCGCGKLADAPHQSLLDCFIKADGTYDPHASGCALCVDIAIDAEQWQRQGASVADIRTRVDSKYGDFGPATDTPPVFE